jgi:hypothetical protein
MKFKKSKQGKIEIHFSNPVALYQVLPFLLQHQVKFSIDYPESSSIIITILSPLVGELAETIKTIQDFKIFKWEESVYPFGRWIEDSNIPHQLLSSEDTPLCFYRKGWLFKKKDDRPYVYCLEDNTKRAEELDNPNLITIKLGGFYPAFTDLKTHMETIDRKYSLLLQYPPTIDKENGEITLNPRYPLVLLSAEESILDCALRLYLFSEKGLKLTKPLVRKSSTTFIYPI